ncbi:hypothetical protein [Avibacterium paragallinarum]|uniref:Uncharacterized protein n=1 Tax=Avibacterium paragallinarum TaxID=728 RepID=A0ABU7QPS9_AVIPA|nr:hypothetical protein [Avibacterium paragallinarum]
MPWDVTSDVELSSRNIKTESDLSQYQDSPSNQKNTEADAEIQQDRQFLQNTLGDFASQIELVSRVALQGNKQSAEGFFENGKAYLVTDNIKGDDIFSREERLAWVAWHELGHNGVNVRFSANHKNLMEFARTNHCREHLKTQNPTALCRYEHSYQ